MAKLLICDDEPGIRTVIRRYAASEGHETVEAGNGREAIDLCLSEDFDLIIMDIMMPVLDGYQAVRKIRETKTIPIIMLSARGEEYDKILGFELGVDDYVVKPFSSKELMLRISAILRRNRGSVLTEASEETHMLFEHNGFCADLTAYRVSVDGQEVSMAPKEYDLLFFLIRNKNIAVSRERILSEVWGYDSFGDARTLDTHMKLLRRSMGPYGSLITTLRGLGYRFDG